MLIHQEIKKRVAHDLIAHITVFRVVVIANRLVEADSLMTWVRDGAVKLRMTESGHGALTPVTVITAFKETVDRVPNRIALCEFHCN